MTGEHREWHHDVIPDSTQASLRALRDAAILRGFYLAGGTGLALQFGHRLSLDLDFFIPEHFDEEALLQRVQMLSGFALVSRAPYTLHIAIETTKVSLLGYKYPLLYPANSFLNVEIADPHDIACMKLSAISARGAKRDFVDVYFCARRFGLDKMLVLFEKKYQQAKYSRVHILKSLTYFDDAEADPPPHMLVPFSWDETKLFFLREVPRLL